MADLRRGSTTHRRVKTTDAGSTEDFTTPDSPASTSHHGASVASASATPSPVVLAPGKSQPLSIRAWKYFTSKTLDTKLGRKFALNSLGEHGIAITNLVVTLASNALDETKTQSLLRDFLKLLNKTQTTISQKGKFTRNDSALVQEPIHTCIFELLYFLEHYDEGPQEIMIMSFRERLFEALSLWSSLMDPYLTAKNYKMMTDFISSISSLDFVTFVLKSEDLKKPETRKDFAAHIRMQLDQFQIALPLLERYCELPFCGKNVLAPIGMFKGSRYCRIHHEEKYSLIKADPHCEHFISTPENIRYLQDFLREVSSESSDKSALWKSYTDILAILLAIREFRETVIWKDRDESALHLLEKLELVSDRFLENEISKEISANVTVIRAADGIIPLKTFERVYKILEDVMDSAVMPVFVKSKEYARFLESNRTPPESAYASEPAEQGIF